MRRTRKWAFVAQEASRLAALGLSPKDIAARLGVNKSSVTRWMAKGKLPSTRKQMDRPVAPSTVPVRPLKTPAEWAADVRMAYDLDATDNQLVTLGEAALAVTFEPTAPAQIRLQAAGRFQAIVKQLALVARASDAAEQPKPVVEAKQRWPARIVRHSGADPRKLLMAVK